MLPNLSNLNEISEESKQLNTEIEQFTRGLYTLARHWRGQEGVDELKDRVAMNQQNGLPPQEALIEAYHYVRDKVI